MRIQQFLAHHGLSDNPFTQEDAKEDFVFKKGCIDHSFHPLWGKIYGHPEEPSAAVVLGERGSGKTALRYQIVDHLRKFNRAHPDRRVLVIEYHDFNPFLDAFRSDVEFWELRDHMDAILSLGTRKLVSAILGQSEETEQVTPESLGLLSREQRRDVLMLAATYDYSEQTGRPLRNQQLRWALSYPGLVRAIVAKKEAALGVIATLVVLGLWLYLAKQVELGLVGWLAMLLPIGLGWWLYLRRWLWGRKLAREIKREIRVLRHDPEELHRLVMKFERQDLAGQPVERLSGDDARYSMLAKLLAVAKTLGFAGTVVIVDRVDEPKSVEGNADRMFHLMRSIFDLKFLGYPHLGVKLLLPGELYLPMQRHLVGGIARIDKLNFVRSLQWSGSSLADLINTRLQACAIGDSKPTLRMLLDDAISDREIIDYLDKLKIPRNAFKFLDRMFARHCQSHLDERPVWKITRDTYVEAKTDFLNFLDNFEKGLPVG